MLLERARFATRNLYRRKECTNGCTRQRKQPNSSGARERTAGKAGGAGNNARFRYERDIGAAVNMLHATPWPTVADYWSGRWCSCVNTGGRWPPLAKA